MGLCVLMRLKKSRNGYLVVESSIDKIDDNDHSDVIISIPVKWTSYKREKDSLKEKEDTSVERKWNEMSHALVKFKGTTVMGGSANYSSTLHQLTITDDQISFVLFDVSKNTKTLHTFSRVKKNTSSLRDR